MARALPSMIVAVVAMLLGAALGATPRGDLPSEGGFLGTEAVLAARERLMAGDLDAAEEILRHAGDSVEEVEQLALFGLIALERGAYAEAAERFQGVLAERPNRTAVWLYLGQAYYALGENDQAIEAFQRGAEVGREISGYFLLRARAEFSAGRHRDAFVTIEEGIAAFPDLAELHRERTIVLLELGLAEAARESGRRYVELAEGDRFAWLALAEAHERAGRPEEAAMLLEEARLRFPDDVQVASRLAYAYAQRARAGAAGRLFHALIWRAPRFAFEAADQLRMAGAYRAALTANAFVAEPRRKLGQRLAITVAAGRYERAFAMRGALEEAGLYDDPDVRIRLAFAALEVGRPDVAVSLLQGDMGSHEPTAASLRAEARAASR